MTYTGISNINIGFKNSAVIRLLKYSTIQFIEFDVFVDSKNNHKFVYNLLHFIILSSSPLPFYNFLGSVLAIVYKNVTAYGICRKI